MTDKHRDSVNDGADPMVSGAYRRLASETAPDDLNRAVLRAARKPTTRGWQGAWFRPLTAAAVVALSVAMMLEFNSANNIDASLPATVDAFRDASNLAAEQIREAEATASRATQNAPADTMPSAVATEPDQPSLLPNERGCDEQQRSSMASWWRCIESLQDQGARAQAEQELATLLRSYPAFVEPNP
jgi:hypothetical protein